jgi:hypothetical protein
MRISEHAFDYDGCIGNYRGEKKTPGELMAEEAVFWRWVKRRMHAESTSKSRRYVSIATARQSKSADDHCTAYNNSTSAFPLYLAISDYLDAQLDPFLLADVRGGLTSGLSFNHAINLDYHGSHADWHFDESKITIIYGRMHRLATRYPGAEISLSFYDDRRDILAGLHAFYTLNRNLLPSNLVLNLYQYVRGTSAVRQYGPVSGMTEQITGSIDFHYKKILKAVGEYLSSHQKEGIPIGISDILMLNLGEMIQRLRRDAAAEVQAVLERAAERRLKHLPRVGHMIFNAAEVTPREPLHPGGASEENGVFLTF